MSHTIEVSQSGGYRVLVDGVEAGAYVSRDAGMAHHALALEDLMRLRTEVERLRRRLRVIRDMAAE